MAESIEDLVSKGARLARAYAREPSASTLRDLAGVIVELRRRFTTEDGATDWAGRSGGYRKTVSAIYSQAGMAPDALEAMQAALRYHVGNVLRDRAPAHELDALGLKSKSPVERTRETRERLAALARAGAAAEGLPDAPADVGRMIPAAGILLARVEAEALADVSPGLAARLDGILGDLIDRAQTLRAALAGRIRPAD